MKNWSIRRLKDMQYEPIITNCARMYAIPSSLICAIIQKESSWNPYAFRYEDAFWRRYAAGIRKVFAVTPTTKDDWWLSYPIVYSASYGLMQLMLTTAMERGFRFTQSPFGLFDPATNIKWGCDYLKSLYNKYGAWPDAISAYNQGNNRKRKDGKFVNQEAYVDIVLQYQTKEA
jgi:soluble lytic murein transglycosylase-like protein